MTPQEKADFLADLAWRGPTPPVVRDNLPVPPAWPPIGGLEPQQKDWRCAVIFGLCQAEPPPPRKFRLKILTPRPSGAKYYVPRLFPPEMIDPDATEEEKHA